MIPQTEGHELENPLELHQFTARLASGETRAAFKQSDDRSATNQPKNSHRAQRLNLSYQCQRARWMATRHPIAAINARLIAFLPIF
jgi:hypothetical protein